MLLSTSAVLLLPLPLPLCVGGRDAATTVSFLRKYNLVNDFKLNIECNHATLSGETLACVPNKAWPWASLRPVCTAGRPLRLWMCGATLSHWQQALIALNTLAGLQLCTTHCTECYCADPVVLCRVGDLVQATAVSMSWRQLA